MYDGTIVFVQSGALSKFAKQIKRINKNAKKYILISHNSDWTVPTAGGRNVFS